MPEKPTIVYAVTEGEYSDYRIKVLFTTRPLAEEHQEAGGGDAVEAFVLLDRPAGKTTVYSISARIWPDGTVTSENLFGGDNRREPEIQARVEWEYGDYDGIPKPIMEAQTLQAPYSGKDWLVRVSGTDKDRVMKAFQDRVAKARAVTLGVADA